MLQNWDFVDPRLARKLHQITQQLTQLKNKRVQITTNPRISSQAKTKLLAFNDQCIRDLMQILGKHQEGMVEYFDTQVNVLTKKEISSVLGSPEVRKSVGEKVNVSEQLTKLTFDQDGSCDSGRMDTTTNCFNLKISSGESSFQENRFKIQNLNTTGRFTSKTVKRCKETRSFELDSTNRGYTYSYSNQEQPYQTHKKSNKASINRITRRKNKRQLATKQFHLQMEKILHKDTMDELKKLKKQTKQDKQLIGLLYKKIELLEKGQEKRIQQQKMKLQEFYESQMAEMRLKYIELNTIREQNKGLMMRRKELLKMFQK